MRIRSIRPEFWTSEDIAALDIPTRLLFIGLWSYVDDNGVGRDVEKLIRSELFPLDDNPRDSLAMVSRGLQTLFAGGQITRYIADGKPYLHVTAWSKHQKVDKPGRERYPLPTREDAEIREPLNGAARESRESVAPGEGEKGRRGEGEKEQTLAAKRSRFDEFWSTYPTRGGHSNPKEPARQKWNDLVRTIDPDIIISGAKRLAKRRENEDPQITPQAKTWLHQRRWCDDEPDGLVSASYSSTPFTPPAPPGDMPEHLFPDWNRAHHAAHREGRPGPTTWRQLSEAS